MPYFGVEDTFPMHPKVIAAGNAAIGAWVRMGAHCVAHGTNGFISEKEAKIYATSGQLKRLLQCVVSDEGHALLEEVEQNGIKGYRFHDWTQPDVDTIRRIREVRAAAGRKGGRASGAARAARNGADSKVSVEANASAHASAHAQPSAQPSAEAKRNQNPTTEDIDKDIGSYVTSAPYVSNATARTNHIDPETFELATSERNGLSPPVSVGASRLVGTVVSHGVVSDACRTILRIETSKGLAQGRSDDDMAECLRIWLTKASLGANALLRCLDEVDKRKLNGHALPTADRRVLEGEALKAKFKSREQGEITSGR